VLPKNVKGEAKNDQKGGDRPGQGKRGGRVWWVGETNPEFNIKTTNDGKRKYKKKVLKKEGGGGENQGNG